METELLGQILSKNCARLSKTSDGSRIAKSGSRRPLVMMTSKTLQNS